MSYIDEYRDMRIQCKTRLFESVVRQTVQVIVGFYLYLTLTNLILNLHFFSQPKNTSLEGNLISCWSQKKRIFVCCIFSFVLYYNMKLFKRFCQPLFQYYEKFTKFRRDYNRSRHRIFRSAQLINKSSLNQFYYFSY